MEKITRMTLEEISEQIGISRTTIYKVLKDKGNVSEKTRAVVMEALEKYHYVENKKRAQSCPEQAVRHWLRRVPV